MIHDDVLTEVLAEFAHALGSDFSIEPILDTLVHRAVDVLPVTAAGVMLIDDDDELHFAAVSDETICSIEALQHRHREGPCLEAYLTGDPVLVPDLRVDQRFPAFSPAAAKAGLAAVFTFPMRLDERRVGALDLYRDTPGALSAREQRAAQVLADVAAAYVFNAQARRQAAADLVRLQHRALHDPLTGLPNRTLLGELLDHAVQRARRSHLSTAVLFVDLDRFKSVNDLHGHQVGDALLVAVARALEHVVRPGDTVARLSGDEFVILCEDLPHVREAEGIAQRLTRALQTPFDLDGRLVQVSASVGIAVTSSGDDVPESLLRDADLAMYAAKAAGGGGHRFGERSARVTADRRLALEVGLRQALAGGDLQLAYQPIVRASDRLVVSVEALLRWDCAGVGFVPPDVLVPMAERTGLILPLGQWVLREACAAHSRWRTAIGGAVARIAVNVSPHQVMTPGFVESVAEVLHETATDPACLELEVTESVLLDDAPRAGSVLRRLRELGVRLALDDFGTGYSSLTYLKRFPFDNLKVDRTLVSDVADAEPTGRAILSSVVGLARALSLGVVAEGVETQEQLDQVVELGADMAQGYLLSRPLLPAAFEREVLDLAGPRDTIYLPAPVTAAAT